jgi:taurine dioxygenase
MSVSFVPLTPQIGAEVKGVDLGQPIDAATFGQISDGFHRHQILLFRDQKIGEDQHIAFSRRFGELEIHPAAQYLLPGHPEILVLTNEREADGSRGLES